MAPERAHAHRNPMPGTVALQLRDRSGPGRVPGPDRSGPGRAACAAWLVPVGAAASVTAIILTAVALAGHQGRPRLGPGGGSGQRRVRHHLPGRGAVRPGDADLIPDPPEFYVTIVNPGISAGGRDLLTAQVRRTSDGTVTGTLPALPAGWHLEQSVSATADDRTFIVAAGTATECRPPPRRASTGST